MALVDVVKETEADRDYFLVLGAGRSGTSLLAGMLDYHSALRVAFERFAVDYLMGKDLPPGEAKSLEVRLGKFSEACIEVASSIPSYWGNKITTEQIDALSECEGAGWPAHLEAFLQKVVGAKKLIFILRDGRACVRSKLNRTSKDYTTALSNYRQSVRILEYLRKADVEMHECRYESLVAHPRMELEQICHYLGVEFEERMLEGSANKRMIKDYRADKIHRPAGEQNFPAQWTEDMRHELLITGYLDEN